MYQVDEVVKAFGKHVATPLEGEKQRPVAGCLEALLRGGREFGQSPLKVYRSPHR